MCLPAVSRQSSLPISGPYILSTPSSGMVLDPCGGCVGRSRYLGELGCRLHSASSSIQTSWPSWLYRRTSWTAVSRASGSTAPSATGCRSCSSGSPWSHRHWSHTRGTCVHGMLSPKRLDLRSGAGSSFRLQSPKAFCMSFILGCTDSPKLVSHMHVDPSMCPTEAAG